MSFTFNDNVRINNIDDIRDIISNFDEIMAIYDLVGHYKNNIINASGVNNDISFDIVFKGYDDALKMYNMIQRKQVSKYGHIYIPILTLNHNIINVKLIDKYQVSSM